MLKVRNAMKKFFVLFVSLHALLVTSAQDLGKMTSWVDNFDELRARIINACETCACGPYEANINNCALCPFKKGCVKNAGRF